MCREVINSASQDEGTFKLNSVPRGDSGAGGHREGTHTIAVKAQQQQQQQHLIILNIIDQPHRASSVFFWSLFGEIFLEMSNVQLSSSALERLVARRTFPLHRRTSVCRNLFGPVDHEELSREMKSKMREIAERDQQRWNFNFEANTPLDGDYEWEEVPVDKTPVFYQDSVQNGRTRVPETPVKQKPSADSSLPEPAPPMDVLERLAVPESSGAPSQVEVNQENRTDKLNSGKQAHRSVPCVRRKRTAAPENNTQITGEYIRQCLNDSVSCSSPGLRCCAPCAHHSPGRPSAVRNLRLRGFM